MRAWIIIDGEKTGPFDIAQVARRIESGELTAQHYGWVEGMKDWLPLSKISTFQEAFEIYQKSLTPPPVPVLVAPTRYAPAENIDVNRLLVRRLFARWFDMLLWSMFFMCLIVFAKADFMGLMMNLWFNYSMMLVWVLLESVMIHLWGCTPGKALLGIRVRRVDGAALPLGSSLLRALRAYLMGMGMSHPILMPLCHGFSWWFVRKHGATLWDGPAGFHVSADKISVWRWVCYALLLFTIMNIAGVVLEPVTRDMMEQWMPKAPVKP